MTKEQGGKERFIRLTLQHGCSSLKDVRAGTQTAGADAEAMQSAVY